jgi:hypothetical protein
MIVEDIKHVEGKGYSLIELTYSGEYPDDKDIFVALIEHYGYGHDYEIVDLKTIEEGGKVYIREVTRVVEMTELLMNEYLAKFPAEWVNTCFSHGPHTSQGREGSYYCAGCDKYLGDVYEFRKDDVPMKNEEGGHCHTCRTKAEKGEK